MKRIHLIVAACLALMAIACNAPQNKDSKIMNNEECLICGAPLQYLSHADTMECVFCKRRFVAEVCCTHGHYVCDECHTSGVDSVIHACLGETSTDPVEVLERMMAMPFCHMHGPEHHILVGAALLTAYHNAGGEVDLAQALPEMVRRGKQVPGGACGSWGACGAALSTGMFVSIVTRNSPLATDAWHLSNLATAEALTSISAHGGPRCCKRDSYLALQSAVKFCSRELGVDMTASSISCTRSAKNNQCIGNQCPFFPAKQ